jgi:hypothetical protein
MINGTTTRWKGIVCRNYNHPAMGTALKWVL